MWWLSLLALVTGLGAGFYGARRIYRQEASELRRYLRSAESQIDRLELDADEAIQRLEAALKFKDSSNRQLMGLLASTNNGDLLRTRLEQLLKPDETKDSPKADGVPVKGSAKPGPGDGNGPS